MESTDWTTTVPGTNFWNPYSLNFDGSNDHILLTNNASLQLSTGTISAWVKASSPGSSFRSIVTKQNAYGLFLQDGVLVAYDWGAITTRSTGLNLADGAWHHVALSFRSGVSNGSQIYSDGVSQLTTTITVSAQDQELDISKGGTGGQYITGSIDDVRAYNRVLTLGEVQSLANGNQSTGSGVYVLGSALNLNGNLGIYAGTLDVSSSDLAVTLSGSWINHGGFTARSGTVTFDSTSQTLSGNTVFSNLTKTVTSADTLFFDPEGRQSVSGALTLRGAASNLLSLRTTRSGSATNLLLDNSAGTQTLDYLDVMDSDATGGAQLVCETSSLTEGCLN